MAATSAESLLLKVGSPLCDVSSSCLSKFWSSLAALFSDNTITSICVQLNLIFQALLRKNRVNSMWENCCLVSCCTYTRDVDSHQIKSVVVWTIDVESSLAACCMHAGTIHTSSIPVVCVWVTRYTYDRCMNNNRTATVAWSAECVFGAAVTTCHQV